MQHEYLSIATFGLQYLPTYQTLTSTILHSPHTLPNVSPTPPPQVEYAGVAVPDAPFRVLAADRLDPSMVRLFGPALEPGVRAQLPTHFNVDAHGAGKGTGGVVCVGGGRGYRYCRIDSRFMG